VRKKYFKNLLLRLGVLRNRFRRAMKYSVSDNLQFDDNTEKEPGLLVPNDIVSFDMHVGDRDDSDTFARLTFKLLDGV
jgi:hypothetical protein